MREIRSGAFQIYLIALLVSINHNMKSFLGELDAEGQKMHAGDMLVVELKLERYLQVT